MLITIIDKICLMFLIYCLFLTLFDTFLLSSGLWNSRLGVNENIDDKDKGTGDIVRVSLEKESHYRIDMSVDLEKNNYSND